MDKARAPGSARLARSALGMALLAAALALLAGLGYRFSWWSLGPAIAAVMVGALLAAGAVLGGLLASLIALRAGRRGPLPAALSAMLIGLAVALPPGALYLRARDLPRIHDISTDAENPPPFVAVLPLLESAGNSPAYRPENAALQRAAYPEVVPKFLEMAPADAFACVLRAVRETDWDIVAVSPADYRIEATDSSLFFGFKDDVVIRLTPDGAGSRLDLRSRSRVGVSDLGVNAGRIRDFLKLSCAG